MHQEHARIDEQIADIQGIAANAEHALGHEVLGVDFLVQAAAFDIGVSDDDSAERQAGKRDEHGDDVQGGLQRRTSPYFPGRRRSEEQQKNQDREGLVSVSEQKVSDADHRRLHTGALLLRDAGGKPLPFHHALLYCDDPAEIVPAEENFDVTKPGFLQKEHVFLKSIWNQNVFQCFAFIGDFDIRITVLSLEFVVILDE